jgi:FAD/FMN-containing dehydrogenase
VIDYLPTARAPLAEPHPWHVLIELVADADRAEGLPDLAERLLISAFEAGLVTDATIAASETQADQIWLIRESIAPAERAIGPAVQHDISVPVERMPEFVETAVPLIEAAGPAPARWALAIWATATSISTFWRPPGRCRGMAGRRWQGDQPPGPRSRHPVGGRFRPNTASGNSSATNWSGWAIRWRCT